MNIPPRGSIARDQAELGVHLRRIGRALGKDVPLLGLAGRYWAGAPLVRDYVSPKTAARSDALAERKHPTVAYRAWTVFGYAYLVAGVLITVALILGWV